MPFRAILGVKLTILLNTCQLAFLGFDTFQNLFLRPTMGLLLTTTQSFLEQIRQMLRTLFSCR